MKPLLFLLFAACSPSSPTPDGKAGDDTSASSHDSADPWWDQPASDADGDGFTAADGDCDETDPAVHPGVATDACNDVDDDCDGTVDENFSDDPYEPNDSTATYLGALENGDQVLLSGYLFPATDEDLYSFDVTDDDWSWFSVEAWLYDVPTDADYAVEIRWASDPNGVDQGVVASADDVGLGGYEVADWGGTTGDDDSGRYEVRVWSTSGAGCAFPYSLHLLSGGW